MRADALRWALRHPRLLLAHRDRMTETVRGPRLVVEGAGNFHVHGVGVYCYEKRVLLAHMGESRSVGRLVQASSETARPTFTIASRRGIKTVLMLEPGNGTSKKEKKENELIADI